MTHTRNLMVVSQVCVSKIIAEGLLWSKVVPRKNVILLPNTMFSANLEDRSLLSKINAVNLVYFKTGIIIY